MRTPGRTPILEVTGNPKQLSRKGGREKHIFQKSKLRQSKERKQTFQTKPGLEIRKETFQKESAAVPNGSLVGRSLIMAHKRGGKELGRTA